jgi:transcriptional regulator with XRE-family HTH domain
MMAASTPMAPRARQRTVGGRHHRTEPDLVAARVGARIRALRLHSTLSFDGFVAVTGLGRGYVSELERGIVVPTVGTLARVATALGVTLSDLVLGASEREQLFDELRDAPASLVRGLREQVRKGRRG